MATVSFEISTAFLARMRTAIVAEQPSLAGQTNTVLNEAARVRVRQMVRSWIQQYEMQVAGASAAAAISPPNDADIT